MQTRTFGARSRRLSRSPLGAIEVRLKDDADVRRPALAEAPVDRERRIDVARLLHVHAHEVAVPRRMRREAREVLARQLRVEREAEVGRLDREVRAQPRARDAVEHALVLLDDRLRLAGLADALAEQRRVREQPALVELPEHRHRLLERLTGDEAPRAEAHPVPADEAADRLALGGGEDHPSRERVDRVREHVRRSRQAPRRAPRSRASRRAPSPPSPRRDGRRAASAAPHAAARDRRAPRAAIARMASANASSVSFASVSVGSIMSASGTTSGK